MQVKKILFCVTKGNFGGAQKYVYDLATNAPREFSIVVACGDQDGDILRNKLAEKKVRTILIIGSGKEVNIKKDVSVMKQLIHIIKEEKPDLVHLNSSKMGLLGSIAVLCIKTINFIKNDKYRPKVVFTAHGWAFNETNRKFLWKIAYWISYYFAIMSCNLTIAVSEKTKSGINMLPFVERKMTVIHNGIRRFKIKNIKDAREILLQKHSNKIILASISELHNSKGIDIGIKAVSKLPDNIKEKILYIIIGDGEEKENLEKLIIQMEIKNNVIFMGFVENAFELMSGIDILIMPSRNENLPYTILEAGIAGLPVIATCVGGIPEIITDMQNGILVRQNDPREIAEAIEYILKNPEKKKMFKSNIKKTIDSKFSMENMIKKTYSLYNSLFLKT